MLRARQMMAALRVITLIHHGDVHIYTAINKTLKPLLVEILLLILRNYTNVNPSHSLPMQTDQRQMRHVHVLSAIHHHSVSRLEKASLIWGVLYQESEEKTK